MLVSFFTVLFGLQNESLIGRNQMNAARLRQNIEFPAQILQTLNIKEDYDGKRHSDHFICQSKVSLATGK